MKFVISTSSMRRIAWKALRSCSPDSSSMCCDSLARRALSGWTRSPLASSRRVTGSCASQSTCQTGMQLAQFARDGDVAPAVPEADRRGEIERLLLPARGGPSACRARRCPSRRSRKSLISALHLAGKRPSGLWPPPARVTSSAPAPMASATASPRACGWIWSSSPWISSTGQRILRYIASLTSKAGAIARASTVLTSTAPLVLEAHSMPSSICLVECGSEKMLRDEVLGEVGIVRAASSRGCTCPSPRTARASRRNASAPCTGSRARCVAAVPARIAAFTRSGWWAASTQAMHAAKRQADQDRLAGLASRPSRRARRRRSWSSE